MVTIRKETADDCAQITEVIDQALDGMPYAAGDESDVVLRLRAANALTPVWLLNETVSLSGTSHFLQ